jgi:hypothetical protein
MRYLAGETVRHEITLCVEAWLAHKRGFRFGYGWRVDFEGNLACPPERSPNLSAERGSRGKTHCDDQRQDEGIFNRRGPLFILDKVHETLTQTRPHVITSSYRIAGTDRFANQAGSNGSP